MDIKHNIERLTFSSQWILGRNCWSAESILVSSYFPYLHYKGKWIVMVTLIVEVSWK